MFSIEGVRLEDAPRAYIQFLLTREVWKGRPDLWRALSAAGLVFEEPPPPALNEADESEESNKADLQQHVVSNVPNSDNGPITTTSSSDSNSEELKDDAVDYIFDFGMHEGKRWDEVDQGYRDWIFRKEVYNNKARKNLLEALLKAGFQPPQEEEEEIENE